MKSTSTRRTAMKLSAAVGAAAIALRAQHQHEVSTGPLANATVSFGAWKTDPPLDRFAAFSPPTNEHELIPAEVTIKAGGSVNFIIAGFHLVLVYGNGTQPSDIDTSQLIPGPPVALINDPDQRIYRGLDPRTQPLDRAEVVYFEHPGTYLVICGVLPHFNDGMLGFVRVLP